MIFSLNNDLYLVQLPTYLQWSTKQFFGYSAPNVHHRKIVQCKDLEVFGNETKLLFRLDFYEFL